MSSFFLVSTEMTGLFCAKQRFTAPAMWRNCASRSGWSSPSSVFRLLWRLYSRSCSSCATFTWLTGWLCRASSFAIVRVLLQVQRSGDSGSPRVSSSMMASNVCRSCGSETVMGLRPAPGRRRRPAGNTTPCRISLMPLAIALRDSPHARLTRLTPPWPTVIASLAAMRRRARSSNNGHTARNFAVSLARLSTPGQHSTNQREMVPSFLYGCLTERMVLQQEVRGVFDFPREGEQLLTQLKGRLELRATVPITPEAIDHREELWSLADLLTQFARPEIDRFHFRCYPAHRTHQRRAQRRSQL